MRMATCDAEASFHLLDKLFGSHVDRVGPFRRLCATFRLQRLVDPSALRGLKLAEATEPERIANLIDFDDAVARGRRLDLGIASMCLLFRMRPPTARTMFRSM